MSASIPTPSGDVHTVELSMPWPTGGQRERRTARAVFGQWVEACEGVVSRCRGDLYADALWLQDLCEQDREWVAWFSCGEWGTTVIRTMPEYTDSDEYLYRYEVSCRIDGRYQTVTITRERYV